MKTKFITLAITAIMVVMAATTVFAATGTWKRDETTNVWTCTDKDGNAITQDWVKSGDAWFWLDENGQMATGQLVDDGNGLYCVDENGKMIKSNWVKVNDDNFDNKWLYFGSNGRAYQDGWKTIKNEKYHFTGYAMDQGFLDGSDTAIDSELDAPWMSATYFVGEDGAMKKNYWLEVEDFDAANGKGWVFFGANGKKLTNQKKTINGSTYVFDDNGLMITSFLDATVSSASISVYMDKDGKMLKKGWVYAYANEDADEQNWFYAQNSGELVKNCVKTINDKKYAFDADGKMMTGFVAVVDNVPVSNAVSAADVKKADMYTPGCDYMYFAESASPSEQGPAVKGKTTIEVEDGKATINFNSRGIALVDGEVVKSGYLYINSVLYNFEDASYKYEPKVIDGVQYVITLKTGRASKSGTFTDADNDIKYILKDGVLTVQHRNSAGKWE